MSESIVATRSVSAVATGLATRAAMLRALLVVGCAMALLIAAALGRPEVLQQADAELARLLRGMALIKGALLAAALAALWWRFGLALAPRLALVYLVGAWLMAAASMLVWQLTLIPAAAVVFHAGELGLLLAAWRDRRDRP